MNGQVCFRQRDNNSSSSKHIFSPSDQQSDWSIWKGRVGWARVAEVGCGASPSPSMTQFGIAARFNATSSAVSEAAAANAASGVVHTVPQTEPVVSAEWLHANLRDPNVLDASWSEDDGEFLIPIEFILCRFLRHDLDCHSHVQVQ
ncbi:uncharacterized protein [Triticum aestivum]|uniref:uncharacterized protein isoform X2 n=1 Tax=Triticum aestivum TaxID=4565 RepID=UPI001D0294F2|nr:uncharacterized protein LOC123050072 isoform X2 [Triticum aestivum]